MVSREAVGDVVSAADEECFEERASAVTFARGDVEFVGFDEGIAFGDGDRAAEAARLDDEERGEEFLGARDGAAGVCILFVKDLAGGVVDDDGRAGDDARGVGGPGGLTVPPKAIMPQRKAVITAKNH